MKVTLVVLALLGCALASQSQWEQFKATFNKNYEAEEEAFRKIIFEERVAHIKQHNVDFDLGIKSYSLGINQFTDMTAEEKLQWKGLVQPKDTEIRHEVNDFGGINFRALPKIVDWRKKGLVTPVKNQGGCGSCWAFSTVAALEGQHAKKNKKLVSLSEQDLVDCSGDQGNMGCGGGWPIWAFQYIIKNKGIDTEKSYPYTGEDGTCTYNAKNVGATVKKVVSIAATSEKALQKASATIGPISVAIDASSPDFDGYNGGIYNEADCSTTLLDHAVTVVGYGTDAGQDYWLVKNSWGPTWGLKGYIKMSRNKQNQCGIATNATYPIV